MNAPRRLLSTLVVALALASAARAQSLVVATNTLETGAQSYTFGVITNGATYTVAGSGASVSITNTTLDIGKTASTGIGNLMISNGATFAFSGTTPTLISPSASATSTLSVVSGTFGSTKGLNVGGTSSQPGQMILSNASVTLGGMTAQSGYILVTGGSKVSSTNAQVRLAIDSPNAVGQMDVTGAGTLLTVSNAVIALARQTGTRGILNISDGAVVSNLTTSSASGIGDPTAGGTTGGNTGVVNVVSGGKWVNSGSFNVGSGTGKGGIGLMTVQGPGSYVQGSLISVDAPGGYNSSLVVSNGAYVNLSSQLSVGSGTVQIVSGGIVESTTWGINASKSGTISNVGGIYLFNTPYLVFNNTYGRMFLTDGTIAYHNRSDADVMNPRMTNIVFNGQNTFRMDAASNVSAAVAQNYTFDTGLGATNFVNLELINGASWKNSARLTVGAGGSLLVSNSGASRIDGVLTNLGVIRVINSKVSYLNPVVLSGSYFSDPSTNTYEDNLTVTPSGSLYGSNGDLFVFNKNFLNASTNASSFNLSHAAVLFTNSATHLLILSNSGSVNIGQGWTNFAQVATNFAIGQLSIAAGNRLTIAGNKDSITNALYLGWLDIQGINTNSYANVTNGLFAALNLPNINVYYDKYDARNGWLNANLINDSAAGFNLWGGGLLLPIPEPSALATVAAGVGLLAFLRRRV